MNRFLLQMAGIPGSGKSTLATAIGTRTGAVVLDKDVVMAGALRAGIESSKVGALAYEVNFELAQKLLAEHDVVLDSPANFTHIRDSGAQIACRTGSRYYLIECAVPDQGIAARRINGRSALHALHPTSLEGQDLNYERPETAPLTEAHLTIDTTQPLESCLDQALRYIGRDSG